MSVVSRYLESRKCCSDISANNTQIQQNSAENSTHELIMSSGSDVQPQSRKSTLIEFPGVARTPVPEWRKELSVRVREVQEKRARDAALEAAQAQQSQAHEVATAP